jgi:hypothetical protein
VISIEKQIQAMNWTLERTRKPCEPEWYWASQGEFVTPQRPTPEMVLADVKEMSRTKTEIDAALIETNPKAALAEFRDE